MVKIPKELLWKNLIPADRMKELETNYYFDVNGKFGSRGIMYLMNDRFDQVQALQYDKNGLEIPGQLALLNG